MSDYLPTTVWRHGMDGPEPGIRAMPSLDRPGEVVLQIRHDGVVLSARLTEETLAALHRQAASNIRTAPRREVTNGG